ncbi:MAG: branched-chain amino acid transaminase [Leptonema sp. (in: bacteria)]
MSNLNSIAFHQGEFKPLKDCTVNIMTHALQYGTMVFGGIRGYYNKQKDNVILFRPYDHFKRLLNSAKIMQMHCNYTIEEMVNILKELVKRNQYKNNIYFRPFIYKSALRLSPSLHDVEDSFSVYTLLLDDYLDTNKGLRVAVSSWRRIDENIIPTRAKVSGGYANSALAKSEALQNGFDEAIFLDLKGNVSEGSAENLFIVRDGVIYTPPNHSSILEGITRKSILEIAKRDNLPYEIRDIARSELYISDEVFFTGTGAQVAWIAEIDRRIIGKGVIGPITKYLKEKFQKIVYGEDPEYQDWLEYVY